jgi:hypothetical protein
MNPYDTSLEKNIMAQTIVQVKSDVKMRDYDINNNTVRKGAVMGGYVVKFAPYQNPDAGKVEMPFVPTPQL